MFKRTIKFTLETKRGLDVGEVQSLLDERLPSAVDFFVMTGNNFRSVATKAEGWKDICDVEMQVQHATEINLDRIKEILLKPMEDYRITNILE